MQIHGRNLFTFTFTQLHLGNFRKKYLVGQFQYIISKYMYGKKITDI